MRLEGSLITLASAYPDQLCREIARIAQEQFPGGEGRRGHQWGSADFDTHAAEASSRVRVAGPRRRIRGSELFAVILSECLPWAAILKHPFKRFGHINIQEARAYKSLLRQYRRCVVFVSCKIVK